MLNCKIIIRNDLILIFLIPKNVFLFFHTNSKSWLTNSHVKSCFKMKMIIVLFYEMLGNKTLCFRCIIMSTYIPKCFDQYTYTWLQEISEKITKVVRLFYLLLSNSSLFYLQNIIRYLFHSFINRYKCENFQLRHIWYDTIYAIWKWNVVSK